MARQPSGRVKVSFDLDPEDKAWLDQEAEARGIGRSECLRRFIRANRGAQHYDQTAPARPARRRPAADAGLRPRLACLFKPGEGNPLRCETCGRTARLHP